MYQKALVPLDGSPLAECVLSHIKNLAKEGFVKEITILNVVKVDIPWGASIPSASTSTHSGSRSSLHRESILRGG